MGRVVGAVVVSLVLILNLCTMSFSLTAAMSRQTSSDTRPPSLCARIAARKASATSLLLKYSSRRSRSAPPIREPLGARLPSTPTCLSSWISSLGRVLRLQLEGEEALAHAGAQGLLLVGALAVGLVPDGADHLQVPLAEDEQRSGAGPRDHRERSSGWRGWGGCAAPRCRLTHRRRRAEEKRGQKKTMAKGAKQRSMHEKRSGGYAWRHCRAGRGSAAADDVAEEWGRRRQRRMRDWESMQESVGCGRDRVVLAVLRGSRHEVVVGWSRRACVAESEGWWGEEAEVGVGEVGRQQRGAEGRRRGTTAAASSVPGLSLVCASLLQRGDAERLALRLGRFMFTRAALRLSLRRSAPLASASALCLPQPSALKSRAGLGRAAPTEWRGVMRASALSQRRQCHAAPVCVHASLGRRTPRSTRVSRRADAERGLRMPRSPPSTAPADTQPPSVCIRRCRQAVATHSTASRGPLRRRRCTQARTGDAAPCGCV